MSQRMNLPAAFGAAVKEVRLQRGFTQESLGLEAGISRRWMGEIERGTGNASLLVLAKLPPTLGIGLAALFTRAEQLVEDSPT
jgi:XRE family transcriptional regulator, regulator of sulfur utilization